MTVAELIVKLQALPHYLEVVEHAYTDKFGQADYRPIGDVLVTELVENSYGASSVAMVFKPQMAPPTRPYVVFSEYSP